MNDGNHGDSSPTAKRRDILALLASGAALSGGPGCFDKPREKILPYVKRPPEAVPGVPQWFATSLVVDGFATGLLVASREGRPIKIEGNPDHPASLGGTGAMEQASILGLYDPSRAQAMTEWGKPRAWKDFIEKVVQRKRRGGLRFLMAPQSSLLVGSLCAEIAALHPDVRFCFYAPLERGGAREATGILYGDALDLRYDFRRARTVVSLDADFTTAVPMATRWARDFAASRRIDSPASKMGRFYAVEPGPTPTSSLADHRITVRSVDVPRIAAGLLAEVLAVVGPGRLGSDLRNLLWKAYPEEHRATVRAAAQDLLAARRAGIVIAGDAQPLETHVLAHLLNDALGNLGETVKLQPSALVSPQNTQTLYELAGDVHAGRVDTLVVLESNPVYDAPRGLDVPRLLRSVSSTVHLSMHRDETSEVCRWFVPASHYLEAWGDARAHDGTISFVQPLVAPLYATRTTTSVLAAFAERHVSSDYELLRAAWQRRWPTDFEQRWNEHIQLGLVPESRLEPVAREPRWQAAAGALAALRTPAPPGLELHFEPSPRVLDGRFANNPWLQEMPHPLTKLTWGNAAVVGTGLAAELGLQSGDLMEIRVGGRTLTLPALPLPGHADDSISVELGYGRTGADYPESPIGVDVYPMRSDFGRHAVSGIEARKLEGRAQLALTQEHGTADGREVGLFATLEAYRANPDFTRNGHTPEKTLLPLVGGEEDQWAMTIDTMICTGCSACVIACQAENNIATVGPEGVIRGREMHWMRIDRFFSFTPEGRLEIINQPMLCQHCEKAPCEYVCPVNATVHSPDGLNEMVYNRCVGTRFCSNNCPYKVRRFNWLDNPKDPVLALQANPDVTVRERGVMEKCTYCVQRIRAAQKHAQTIMAELQPGDVVTACQQSCPTGAIAFGLLRHDEAEVAKWRQERRAYAALGSLGAKPRTQYLAKISNPRGERETG